MHLFYKITCSPKQGDDYKHTESLKCILDFTPPKYKHQFKYWRRIILFTYFCISIKRQNENATHCFKGAHFQQRDTVLSSSLLSDVKSSEIAFLLGDKCK